MTFSIIGHCERSGMFGIAISSSSPAVAARCAHARAGVGVVATQNITDPRLGPQGLELMASGASAEEALARLKATAPHIEFRQLALLDRSGRSAVFSGAHTLGIHHAVSAEGAAAAGNILADRRVPERMLETFLSRPLDHLGDRLLAALAAGLQAGGETAPVHSAGMLLVREVPWPVADLRIDWHATDPIGALSETWSIYKPQLDAYVARALDPQSAPAYPVAERR